MKEHGNAVQNTLEEEEIITRIPYSQKHLLSTNYDVRLLGSTKMKKTMVRHS